MTAMANGCKPAQRITATLGHQTHYVGGDAPGTQTPMGADTGLAGQKRALRVQADDQLLGILFLGHSGGPPPELNPETWAAVTRHVQAAIALARGGQALRVHYFRANSSVFIDGCYLIKGVAGTVLWQLLSEYIEAGQTEFSNRQLRLIPALKLPEFSHNLEVRLRLLQRRLEEQGQDLRIEKVARGRYRLAVTRPVELLMS